jgi:hypothetical protein
MTGSGAGSGSAPGGRRPGNAHVEIGSRALETAGPDPAVLRPTKEIVLGNGTTLTVREPSATETMTMYRMCGDENALSLQLFVVAMTIVAIDGKPTVRTSKKELTYILETFGTMTGIGEVVTAVSGALDELAGTAVKPRDGETSEELTARQETRLRENLESAPASR